MKEIDTNYNTENKGDPIYELQNSLMKRGMAIEKEIDSYKKQLKNNDKAKKITKTSDDSEEDINEIA